MLSGESVRCACCGGGGKVMGGGMMQVDCGACKGIGRVFVGGSADDDIAALEAAVVKPKTKREARKELMADLKISAAEADMLLENA